MAINLFGLSIPQISLPSLPKIEVPKIKIPEPPKIEIPKITVPDIPKVIPKIITSPVPVAAVAGAVGEAAAGAVAGAFPKVELPKISLPEPPKKLPSLDAGVPRMGGSGAGDNDRPATSSSTTGGAGGRLPAFGGVSKSGTVGLEPPPGGNIIDVVIGARDQSYEAGLTRAFTDNVAGGGTQVVATAAVDMLLPMDAVDVANKLATGRGDELTGEDYLFAAIDTLGVAGSVFTLGGSYAASRALKAALKGGKVAIKGNVVGRAIRSARGVGSSALNKGKDVLSRIKTPTPTKAPDPGDVSRIIRETREAQTKMTRQIDDLRDSLVKTFDKKTVDLPTQLPNRLSKTGSALTGAALGAGGTAIALTLSGALGAPAPQEVPEDGGGGNGGGGLPGADQSGGLGDDWWNQLLNSLSGGGAYDPSLYEGYDPYSGYYPPGYPDPFGLEPYAQDIAGMLGEVPVVGAPFEAAAQKGFALPALIGAVVLVVLVVAFLRSKKGEAMIGGVKKKVSGAVGGARKAVGA